MQIIDWLIDWFHEKTLSFDIVAQNGNNVEATFNFVEKTIFYDNLVLHSCR